MQCGAGTPEEQPDIHYNLRPRKLSNFKPYSEEEFVGQNYDIKHAQYWTLGGLGCSASDELKVSWP